MALGAAGVSLAGVLAASGTAAGAAPDSSPGNAAASPAQAVPLHNPVVFIGDSVTAGFGYCGAEEAEKDVS
jgi:hypothetical protein